MNELDFVLKVHDDDCTVDNQLLDGIKEHCDIGCNSDYVSMDITNFKAVDEVEA